MTIHHNTFTAIVNKLIAFCLVYSVCFFVPAIAKPEENLQALKVQFEANKDDPLTAFKLAGAYDKKFQASRQQSDLENALLYLEHFLKLSPDHQKAAVRFYELLFINYSTTKAYVDYKKLEEFYHSQPYLQTASISPPNHLRGLQEEQKIFSNHKKAINYYKNAIQEKPTFLPPYIALSALYQEKELYELALENLDNAKKHIPNEAEIYNSQAELFTDLMYEAECIGSQPEYMNNAIKALREASALNPKDLYPHRRLTRLYQQKGLYELAIHEAQRSAALYKEKPHSKEALAFILADVETDLIEIKISMGQDPKPLLQTLESFYDSQKDKNVFGQILFDTYINTWEWKKANDMSKKLGRFNYPKGFYDALRNALALQHLESKSAAKAYLEKTAKRFTLKPWEKKVYQHYQEVLSPEDYIGAAKNICEKTEAYYYIGLQEYYKKNTEKAYEYFKKTVSLNLGSFTEYQSAVQALRHYPQEKKANE